MRFYVRKRRQAPAVIIVALIDILIVLLIFLMVTTTFRQQPALTLALPESTHAQKEGAQESVPLVVTIDADGLLHLGADSEPKRLTAKDLKAQLIEEAEKNPQLRLAIRADEKAPFGTIIKVMDAAKDAKIKIVNAFTKEAKP